MASSSSERVDRELNVVKNGSLNQDEDDLVLSEHARKALEEFYREQAEKEAAVNCLGLNDDDYVQENWELSQFWYDLQTAETLAEVALQVAGEEGRIACISCPTVASRLQKMKSKSSLSFIFEYDERFKGLFGDYFIFYDYNQPLNLKEELKHSFDLVMVDPPYLSLECLEKVSQTVHFLAKEKVVLCTGAVMEPTAKELLGVDPCKFTPKHANNLGNEFKCFANFDLDSYVLNVNKLSST